MQGSAIGRQDGEVSSGTDSDDGDDDLVPYDAVHYETLGETFSGVDNDASGASLQVPMGGTASTGGELSAVPGVDAALALLSAGPAARTGATVEGAGVGTGAGPSTDAIRKLVSPASSIGKLCFNRNSNVRAEQRQLIERLQADKKSPMR